MAVSRKNKYVGKDGKSLPGVTTILQSLPKPALLEWAWKLGLEGVDYKKVRDTRAGIGTLAHAMVEADLTGIPVEDKMIKKYSGADIEIALKCFAQYELWKKEQKDFEVIAVELVMSDDDLGFGGTCDLYYKSKGKYILMDFKTSKNCYDEHKAQQAAYKMLLEKQGKRVDEIKLFQINENRTGVIDIKKVLIPLYTALFQAAFGVYKALRALDIVLKRSDTKSSKYKKKKADIAEARKSEKKFLKAVKL